MGKRTFHVIFASIVGLMFVFGEVICIYAQETEWEEFTLEEVIVTAQKRAQDQQKVPIVMEVISGEDLAITGKTNINDILSNISSVLVNTSVDGMRVSIRGITEYEGFDHDVHSATPAVAINIDGAYNSRNSAGMNLFDVERIEVLYGPQSTLYASTSPGGIVNVVTAAPKMDRYSADISVEAGSFGLKNYQFTGNAPILKDTIAMRLATQIYQRDPFVSGSTDVATESRSARLKTLFEPNDKFSATVTLNYTERSNAGLLGGQVRIFDYEDGYWYTVVGMNDAWIKDVKVTDPWTAPPPTPTFPGQSPRGPTKADQTTKGITGEINWDIEIGNVSVVPQYSTQASDDQGNYTGDDDQVYTVFTDLSGYQKGVEVRMTSAEDFFFKWIAGYNLYKSHEKRLFSYNEPGAVDRSHETWMDSKAIFANITYPFLDKFRGSIGSRMTWESVEALEIPTMWQDQGMDYSKPDYSIGVEYDLSENSMLYANYGTSYRMWGQATSRGGKDAEPEMLTAYTIGAKNRFLENKLQLNAATYYYYYDNKMASMSSDGRLTSDMGIYEDELADPDGNPVDVDGDGNYGEHELLAGFMNMDPWNGQWGAFRSIGVDIQADWLATDKDRVTLDISYLNAEWEDLVIKYYWQRASGGHFWPTDGNDYKGYPNTYSADWTITASYEHYFELGSYGWLTPHVDGQYKSDYIMDFRPYNYPMCYQEPYYLYNGSVTFTHSSDKWSLYAYMKNATNYAAKTFFHPMQVGGGMGITDPRTFGVLLSVKF